MRAALFALALTACVRDTRPAPSEDLSKLKIELVPGPMRLMTQGQVGSVPATLFFDVGSPLSTANLGCFEDGPRVDGQVETGFPDGTRRRLPEAVLRNLSFGGQRYVPLKVGIEEGSECAVVLGIDVLLPWALHVNLARRELTFLPSATRLDYQALAVKQGEEGWETHQLELTRDPVGDWPMLALRVKQADEALVAPLVFSTREAATRVSSTAVRGAGLKVGRELFEGVPVPEGITLPDSMAVTDVVATDGLELSPGFGVAAHTLRLDKKWNGKGVAGVLGADVWGRFDAVIDVQGGVLGLKRPRVLESGSVQRCVRGAVTSEEGCYDLFSKPTAQGLEVAVTLWRSLPSGGRLYLDVKAVQQPPCRIGFTFGPTERGASAHFVFPWSRMTESMPECAGGFTTATGASFSLYEEGPLPQCPGTCAFAEDALTRRMSCACEAGKELTDDERAVMGLYKKLLEQELKKRDRAAEPIDP